VEYKKLRHSSEGNKPHMPKGTDTIHFLPISARKATYLIFVATDKPHKANPERVRLTVVGDRIEYKGDFSTKCADITTDNVRVMAVDMKNFYLNMSTDAYEYMRIPS
jgi:hypothetical protein